MTDRETPSVDAPRAGRPVASLPAAASRFGRAANRVAGVAALALAVALAPACRAPRESADGVRDRVRVQMSSAPQSLSLVGAPDRYSAVVGMLVSDSLVRYDRALDIVPRLSESWELAPDRSSATIRLRQGVRWHDGEPFTAEDVAFTVHRVQDTTIDNPGLVAQFDGVRVEVLGEHEVRVVPSALFPGWLHAFANLPMLPKHLLEDVPDLLDSDFARHPIGCGPYRFGSFDPARELVLEANEDYWDGPPAIPRLVAKFFADERTAFEAVFRDEVDLVTMTPELFAEAEARLEGSGLTTLIYDRMSVWWSAYNQNPGSPAMLSDARVRKALVHALDRETFLREATGGLGRPGVATYPYAFAWTAPDVAPRAYDPDAARRLLDEAGFVDTDGDGVRDRDGAPARARLMVVVATQELANRIATWYADSLAKVGVRIDVELTDARAFKERRSAGDYDIAMGSFSISPDPDQTELYHSNQREHGFNFFGLVDPEVDRLLEEGRHTYERDARREIYFALQRRLHDLEPLTGLFYFRTPSVLREDLAGVVTSPHDLYRSYPGPVAWRWEGSGDAGRP